MNVWMVLRKEIRAGLEQHTAHLIDPVTRQKLLSVTRWGEQFAAHEARTWATRHGYIICELRGKQC